MDEEGPVAAAADVVLARPDELHRLPSADGLGDAGRFARHVGHRGRAAAEAAAGQEGVQLDLLRRQAHHERDRALIDGRNLRAGPDLAPIARELHDAVEGLHGGVGEVGELVDRVEGLGGARERRRGIAVAARRGARLRGEGLVLGQQLGGAAMLGLALVPFHDQGRAALSRGPEALRQHRHSGRHLDHVGHAGDLERGRLVDRLHGGPEDRGPGDHGGQHVGEVDVHREAGRAVGLGLGVDPWGLLADELPVLRVLEGTLPRAPVGRPPPTPARRTWPCVRWRRGTRRPCPR